MLHTPAIEEQICSRAEKSTQPHPRLSPSDLAGVRRPLPITQGFHTEGSVDTRFFAADLPEKPSSLRIPISSCESNASNLRIPKSSCGFNARFRDSYRAQAIEKIPPSAKSTPPHPLSESDELPTLSRLVFDQAEQLAVENQIGVSLTQRHNNLVLRNINYLFRLSL